MYVPNVNIAEWSKIKINDAISDANNKNNFLIVQYFIMKTKRIIH
jgi:hypothetical protein